VAIPPLSKVKPIDQKLVDEEPLDSSKMLNTWYCIANAKQWTRAVVFQGRRLLRTSESNAAGFVRSCETDDFRRIQARHAELQEAMEVERIEQYFFVIAVNKAREWLNESADALPELQPIAKDFKDALPDVKDLRDMREHEIDYFKNEGRKQSEFVRRHRYTAADATGTIVDEDSYFIGNRLSVQQAIAVAEQAYQAVVQALQGIEMGTEEE